jgi:hypothetical protein
VLLVELFKIKLLLLLLLLFNSIFLISVLSVLILLLLIFKSIFLLFSIKIYFEIFSILDNKKFEVICENIPSKSTKNHFPF